MVMVFIYYCVVLRQLLCLVIVFSVQCIHRFTFL